MSETVAAQLSRSGDTIFDVREVRSEGCDRFVPVSLLAELRREGLERLRRARLDRPVVHAILPEDRIGALSVESPYGRGECYESSGRGVLPRSRGAANCTRTRSGPATAGHPVMRSAYCIRREIGQCLKEHPTLKGELFSDARPVPIPAPVRLCPVRNEPDRRERSKITKESRAFDWPDRSDYFGGGSCGRVPFLRAAR
mgnify:CR=1 FL=1